VTSPAGVPITGVDPLLVDVYAGDLNGLPNWQHLAELGAPWHGAIIKATEGTWYAPGWFDTNWRQIRHVAVERYGIDWFRGAYHFLKFEAPGIKQAELYLATVARAGGWDVGDFWPIVDVELGGERNSNRNATAAQVVDCTMGFAEKCKRETGRDVMLYGNGAMRDLGIHDRMGCDWLWLPRYTTSLPPFVYERSGWSAKELVMWQYSGDGQSVLAGYPRSPLGFGKCDVSALVLEGGIQRLRSLLWAEDPKSAA